jgi:hypothetical protein
MNGELLIRWSIRVALLLLAGAWFSTLQRRPARAAWCHRAGWSIYVLHVLAAFHFRHHWNHAEAVQHTAEVSLRVTGIEAGYGIYFNHFFTAVWGWLAWQRPVDNESGHRSNGQLRFRLAHGYLAFMVVQGAVIFAPPGTAVPAAVILGFLLVRYLSSVFRREGGRL